MRDAYSTCWQDTCTVGVRYARRLYFFLQRANTATRHHNEMSIYSYIQYNNIVLPSICSLVVTLMLFAIFLLLLTSQLADAYPWLQRRITLFPLLLLHYCRYPYGRFISACFLLLSILRPLHGSLFGSTNIVAFLFGLLQDEVTLALWLISIRRLFAADCTCGRKREKYRHQQRNIGESPPC